jgi:pimeloyl-ACP methyl ester carboxylesterase
VDGSSVLDLPEVTEAFEARSDPLSEQSVKAIGRAFAAGADRLRAEGVDLDGYTMLDCIEDNESVRRALGYGRINLLSASYGTRIAYLYALRHPDRVFRSAMISVNPPGHFVWEPATTDAQLKHYATLGRDTTAVFLISRHMRTVHAMPDQAIPPDRPGRWGWTFALLFHARLQPWSSMRTLRPSMETRAGLR